MAGSPRHFARERRPVSGPAARHIGAAADWTTRGPATTPRTTTDFASSRPIEPPVSTLSNHIRSGRLRSANSWCCLAKYYRCAGITFGIPSLPFPLFYSHSHSHSRSLELGDFNHIPINFRKAIPIFDVSAFRVL